MLKRKSVKIFKKHKFEAFYLSSKYNLLSNQKLVLRILFHHIPSSKLHNFSYYLTLSSDKKLRNLKGKKKSARIELDLTIFINTRYSLNSYNF